MRAVRPWYTFASLLFLCALWLLPVGCGGADDVGGTPGTGGAADTGGTASGGSASGGSASGGSASGGSASGGSGGTATGGTASGGSASGGSPSTSQIFDQCRFHFGTFRDYAIDNADIRSEIDFFIPGWMGLSDTFDQQYVCDDVKGTLAGKIPVVVAYVSAFYAKREENLHDCNVGEPHLCTYGAEVIQNNLDTIIDIYESYAQGYANCLPDGYPIIFEMEPDWFQYTIDEQNDPLTPAEAGSIMNQYVQAIRNILPNAHFSMDISPWVPPENGSDHGADWFSNFTLAPFAFINTSGGGTEADNDQIRSTNNMTWAGVSGVTGKPIIADTGYGVNGASEGHDDEWDDPNHINDRINDGVIGVAQYNPKSDWGATLSSIRDQLDVPANCP